MEVKKEKGNGKLHWRYYKFKYCPLIKNYK